MLNPKQISYINLGLDDRAKCAYYCKSGKNYEVYIDSNNDKTHASVVYGIKFVGEREAEYFAQKYISYDSCEFDVFVHGNEIIIDPRTIDGQLGIQCCRNEEMAKKLVKRFRKQNIEKLKREAQSQKDDKKDFKGIQF